ncbi:MAG: carboxypeptidase-like regulatory domain-containing protein, partial [Planctomycetota bacterium]
PPAPAPQTTNGTLIVRVTPPAGLVLSPDALAGSEIKVWFDERRPKLPPELEVELDGLEPGHHAVRVHVPGFTPMERSFELVREQRLELEFELDTGVTLRGRVVDPEGRPVSPAYVSVSCWPERPGPSVDFADDVDEQGRFEFLGVPAGFAIASASGTGFGDVSLELGELEPNSERNGLELVMGLGNRVQGRVQLPDGKPASRAEVRIESTALVENRWSVETRCDGNGAFLLRGLGPGPAQLMSWARQPKPPASVDDAEEGDPDCPRALLLIEVASATNLVVQLEVPSVIDVRYLGADEVNCSVFDDNGLSFWEGSSSFDDSEPGILVEDDGAGVLRVRGLTSGSYWIELTESLAGMHEMSDALLGRAHIRVRAGESSSLTIELQPPTWVELHFDEPLDSFPLVTVSTEGLPPRRVAELGFSLPVSHCGLLLEPGRHSLSILHGERRASVALTVNGEPERELAVVFD